jgi:preprotein translocase subunit SecG
MVKPGKRAFAPPMNKIAKFLGITTVIAPIVLIILTIWMAVTSARPSRAGQHVWSEHVIARPSGVDRVEGIPAGRLNAHAAS